MLRHTQSDGCPWAVKLERREGGIIDMWKSSVAHDHSKAKTKGLSKSISSQISNDTMKLAPKKLISKLINVQKIDLTVGAFKMGS